MSISTRRGDGGTTGLLYGGRVRKDSARIECNGAVDEAQAAIGLARAEIRRAGATGPAGFSTTELDGLLIGVERHLWVLMAEVATPLDRRGKLTPALTLVTTDMLDELDRRVEELEAKGAMPSEFVVPGQSVPSAALDIARTLVRRAERAAVRLRTAEGSLVVPYLNRLSDLCWLLARALEQDHLSARGAPRNKRKASS